MKIDNSRVFLADIYWVENNKEIATVKYKWYEDAVDMDIMFKNGTINETIIKSGVIVVYFQELGAYVPVSSIKNLLGYARIKLGADSLIYSLEDLLTKQQFYNVTQNGNVVVKNVRPYFGKSGKTYLSKLVDLQKLQDYQDEVKDFGL